MTLYCAFSGVQSAEQLTQSEPAVIKPGNSHTLTCKASGFTFSSYWMCWVREIGGKLQGLADNSPDGNTKCYHDDFKGRFTISRDNTNNMLYLKMDKMKTEDTALYYCARYTVIETTLTWNKN
ncbi:unnamed protein product [Staurois parvus]|uniref:Ig-like domain-containing protein n=1 Tax=Staurois parvus TaxID=386267 RepID=A0ABN9AQY9_9NEOB|nr:unnamed protein product [Staurois parvus]